ncbi:uncharacterized protein LOC123510740 [Portunus trituberculatus]|uniref:uncharacterized protein LOC123510740 n=1 Tax=Portunus trituberculatus TaxID=210409 RepID=UPI001E1CB9E7|nr:uncharacterized protein LOC123510740 [Portunus trituberculatus]
MRVCTCVTLLLLLTAWVEAEDKCDRKKKELDKCLAKMAPFMPRVGLPYTPTDLANMCKAFKGGMECVDKYTAACLTEDKQTDLQQTLQGARSFLAFLCDDPVFQKEYLSHGNCLRDVSDDWSKCQHHYKGLVWLQHRIPNITEATRDHNICCIREELLTCVYRYSVFRCRRHEALFVKKVTATLSYSDLQEEKCKNVSRVTCGSSSLSPASFLWLSLCVCLMYLVKALGFTGS